MIYFSKQIKRRRHEKPYETKPIGSAIKVKRKELKMTLEESAEGICSISYLSKLENNLIEPNEVFVKQLKERLNLKDELEIDSSVYKNDLNEILECFLTDQMMDINLLTAYEQIKIFIPNLNDFETAMLSLALSHTLYQMEHYQNAYHILKIGASHAIKSEALNILLMKWTLLCAFKMRRLSDMTSLYNQFLIISTEKQYFKLLQDVNLEYYKLNSIYEEPEKVKMMMKEIRALSKEEKDLIYAKSLFAKRQYEKLYPLSKAYQMLNPEWLSIHIICLDALNKEIELIKLIDRNELFNHLNETNTLLIKHIKIKYKKDKNELLRYLRNELLSNRLMTDNYDTVEYLMTDASQLFSNHQFYKEANQISHEMGITLKSLKMAMQNYDTED
jgi:transcriptional regulator with XRE-family HTH domain